MYKAGTSLCLGLFALIAASSAYPALAQTKAAVPTAVQTTPATPATEAKPEPIKELTKTDIVVGTGAEAVTGKKVTIHDIGWLYSYSPSKPDHKGAKFVSSYDAGAPASFELGSGKKIKGWDQGIVGMKVGGKRTLIIPPELGYGARSMGRGVIPANSALIFEIELIDVK